MIFYTNEILIISIISLLIGIFISLYFFRNDIGKISKIPVESISKHLKLPNRLILIRHGESEGNVDRLVYRTIADSRLHLTSLGKLQAKAAGVAIKNIIQNESVRFIVSPYTRTLETYEYIKEAWGNNIKVSIPYHEEPRIREQDFGNFQDPDEIQECKIQRAKFGAFFYRFPSGESPADVYDRISSFLESLFRMFRKKNERNYVIVTHGVTIRVMLMRYFRYTQKYFETLDNFYNAEFVVLENSKYIDSNKNTNCNKSNESFYIKEIVRPKVNIKVSNDSGNFKDVTYHNRSTLRLKKLAMTG